MINYTDNDRSSNSYSNNNSNNDNSDDGRNDGNNNHNHHVFINLSCQKSFRSSLSVSTLDGMAVPIKV